MTNKVRQWTCILAVTTSVSVGMSFLIGFAPLLEMSVGKVVGIEFTGIPEYYVYFLAAAAGVIVFGIALANPFWGILIFMLLLPFRSEEYALANIGGAVVRLADPVALFTFIGLLNRDIFTRRTGLPLERAGIELPLLVLAWWVFLSFTWCESYRSAVSKLLQFSYAIVLFYMVLALIRTRKQLITAMYSWLLGGLLIGGIALAQAIAGIGGGKGRAVSFQTSAIESGEYLNYSILMAIGLFMIAKSKLGKAFVLSSIALMLLGTILGSAARGPLLGLAFGLLFLYLFRDRFRSYVHWLIPFGVVGSVAAFFVFGLFGQNLLTLVAIAFRRFIELIENPVMDPGWAYRLNIWSALWRLFTEHPLLGIGVGSLSQLLPDYTMEYFRDPELAHNMYLEVFITLGPFGFLLFLWFMWRMLRILAGYLLDKSDYVLYLLYGTLLAAQVAKAVGNLSFGMFFEDRVEWVAIALCFAAAKIYKDSHEARARGAAPEEAGA